MEKDETARPEGAETSETKPATGAESAKPEGSTGEAASKVDASKLYAKARRELKQQLLKRWGLSSIEEADEMFKAAQEEKERLEQERLAEMEEKQELAKKLTALQKQAKELQVYQERYTRLRDSVLTEKLKAEALRAGVLEDAVDLAVLALKGAVEWGDDDSIKARKLAGDGEHESLSALVEELKATKPFLFRPPTKGGTGLVGGGRPPKGQKASIPYVDLGEAATWGRTPRK